MFIKLSSEGVLEESPIMYNMVLRFFCNESLCVVIAEESFSLYVWSVVIVVWLVCFVYVFQVIKNLGVKLLTLHLSFFIEPIEII